MQSIEKEPAGLTGVWGLKVIKDILEENGKYYVKVFNENSLEEDIFEIKKEEIILIKEIWAENKKACIAYGSGEIKNGIYKPFINEYKIYKTKIE